MNIDRYFSPKLKPFGNLSKPVVLKSRKHIQWIKDRKCAASGQIGQVDAHHVQLRSKGLNDYLTIPLRHDIHMQGHQEGFDVIEGLHGFDIKDALIAALCERVWELENGLDKNGFDKNA